MCQRNVNADPQHQISSK